MDSSTVTKVFGTDGVRGRANQFPMTVEVALSLGRAAGKLFRRHEGKHRVVVGKDTRLSCYMFENALISGLCSMGVDTLMVGPLPTPGVAFITRAYRADAGIVISASHNPYYDNGIKFFSSDGYKLSDRWEHEMEKTIAKNAFDDCLPSDGNIGKNTKIDDASGRYIEFVKATIGKKMTLRNLKVVVDCSNGAGYRVAPLIFRELDATVFPYGVNPNGLNINDGCGSLHPETVQKGVIEHHAHVGIALDGDADRVIMVDENAQIVDGDAILAICAEDMLRQGLLKNQTVVSTVMANLGIVKHLEAMGIKVVLSQVGDRYVIQDLIDHDAILGGEQSGHLIFLEHNTTGDGLVSALQVLRIMIETDTKLSELVAKFRRYPQKCVNVKVREKPPVESLPEVAKQISHAEKELGDKGRVLVRYSGTESVCRVMIEGQDRKRVKQIADTIARAIENAIGVKI